MLKKKNLAMLLILFALTIKAQTTSNDSEAIENDDTKEEREIRTIFSQIFGTRKHFDKEKIDTIQVLDRDNKAYRCFVKEHNMVRIISHMATGNIYRVKLIYQFWSNVISMANECVTILHDIDNAGKECELRFLKLQSLYSGLIGFIYNNEWSTIRNRIRMANGLIEETSVYCSPQVPDIDDKTKGSTTQGFLNKQKLE